MATILDVIKKSLRPYGVSNPTATEASDALSAVNAMLESWSIERLYVYQIMEETFTWAGGNTSRTIGVGGNFNTSNPTNIVSGFTRINSIDYPFDVIEKNEYDAIAAKSTQSQYPDKIYFDNAATLGTLYAYPVPSASISIHINSWKPLQSFTALTDVVALPPGYRRAIEACLSVELQGDYPDLPLPASVIEVAKQSKSSIKTFNTPTIYADLGLGGGRRYNIFSDT
jgi:hypothetical protein